MLMMCFMVVIVIGVCMVITDTTTQQMEVCDVGVGRGLTDGTTAAFEVQCRLVDSGTGMKVITGIPSPSPLIAECVSCVEEMMYIQNKEIRESLGKLQICKRRSVRSLRQKGWDLHIHFVGVSGVVDDCSCMGALAMAMLSFMARRRPQAELGIVGQTSQGGMFMKTFKWTADHVNRCASHGIRKVVVSTGCQFEDGAKEAADTIGEDGRPKLEFVLRNDMLGLEMLGELFGIKFEYIDANDEEAQGEEKSGGDN